MRIAAYGFIGEHAGSLASGNSLVIKELLARGHRIDLYAIDGFIGPDTLAGMPGFRYFPVRHTFSYKVWKLIERLPKPLARGAGLVWSTPSNYCHYAAIADAMEREHRREPYDAFAVFGLLAPFRLGGVRTVSWSQGTVNGEAGWLLRNAGNLIRNRCGLLIPPLAGLYAMKIAEAMLCLKNSDAVLCGSEWAVESWRRFGIPRHKLGAVPYPIDLDQFQVTAMPADSAAGPMRFLHLGRIVPRKRFDLLLEGFAVYRRSNPLAELKIVGSFSYGAGYRRLLSNPRLNQGVEYHPAVPRSEVPAMLAHAHAVVQPSENENFGSAGAEALACGRPVLLGPTNGTKDYISPSSVVFAAYTPEAVAAGMMTLAERIRANPALIPAESRATAERFFRMKTVADAVDRTIRG